MNRPWDFKIAVNGAILKLDLERVQCFAVTDGRESARFDRPARDARLDGIDGKIGAGKGVEEKDDGGEKDSATARFHSRRLSLGRADRRAEISAPRLGLLPLENDRHWGAAADEDFELLDIRL